MDRMFFLWLSPFVLIALLGRAQPAGQKTYCNPIDIYQTYQVFADQGSKLELRALTIDQNYNFAIESFNESGVSKASPPVQLK